MATVKRIPRSWICCFSKLDRYTLDAVEIILVSKYIGGWRSNAVVCERHVSGASHAVA